MTSWTPKNTLIVASVAVVGLWYFKSKATETAKEAAQAVNPTNHNNIFNRAFESIYAGGSDGEGTLGTDLYDYFHGE